MKKRREVNKIELKVRPKFQRGTKIDKKMEEMVLFLLSNSSLQVQAPREEATVMQEDREGGERLHRHSRKYPQQ